MTGFRYGLGGYHTAVGLAPDLITLSKGLANGMALSAIAGRAEVLNAAEKTYPGNTYQREITPFAAALSTPMPCATAPRSPGCDRLACKLSTVSTGSSLANRCGLARSHGPRCSTSCLPTPILVSRSSRDVVARLPYAVRWPFHAVCRAVRCRRAGRD